MENMVPRENDVSKEREDIYCGKSIARYNILGEKSNYLPWKLHERPSAIFLTKEKSKQTLLRKKGKRGLPETIQSIISMRNL